MTTISLVPSSPSLERESAAFFPPIQAAQRVKGVRIASRLARAKPARHFPRTPEDSRIEFLGFAILAAATGATLFFSAVALLEFAAR